MSHATPPSQHRRLPSLVMKLFPVFCLFVLLFVQLFGSAIIARASVISPTKPPIPKASFTLGQFLNQASPAKPLTETHIPSAGSSAVQNNGINATHAPVAQALPPSAEPPTMKTASASIPAISVSVSSNIKGASAIPTPALHLSGSDPNGVRMEVTIPSGALDFSTATLASGVAPQGNLTVTLTQTRGHFLTATRDLATYQIQVTDAKGQIVQGIKLRTPVTYTFHYQKSELSNLQIDPNHLSLFLPTDTATNARTTVVPLLNHAASNTLTATVSTLTVAAATVSGGTEPIQAPPKPRFASVQGNGGQISYSYPFTVAPGPQGVTPQLQLNYSSGTTNGRHDPTTPPGNAGDGWTLSLGSISAEQYPDGTIWYSLSGIDGVSDRLIPNKNGNGDYATEHMSYLKVSRINNPAVSGHFCFNVWDGSGTKYELGCTKDALQSYHDSDNDQFDYAFDLDKITASNEGSGTNNRTMTVSYLQEIESENGHTSVRDAAPQQIVYKTTSGGNTTPAGTVDFFYNGPSNSTTNGIQFETQYTGAYESACHLPASSTQPQRCDDPLDRNGLSDPAVMSTLELTKIKSYVGDDSTASHLDYSYAFTYIDTPFLNCPSDASNLSNYWCAGEHVLTAITPTVFQNGASHQLAGMSFTYSDHTNRYNDFTQNPHYHMENTWAYLISYHDHSNGVGANITYQTAWNNSHGTPFTAGDNRTDTFYCNNNPNNCTSGPSNPTNDLMWTEQVVTVLNSVGKDSSNSNLSSATTHYGYWLAQTQGSCPADSQGNNACVGFGWMPNSGDSSSAGSYYHGEFRGFGTVLITVPNGDNTSQPFNLTVQKYAATFGWGSSVTDSRNYLAGTLLEEDVYQGPNVNGANLIQKTENTYAGQNINGTVSTPTACSTVYTTTHTPTYTPCEVVLLSSKTTNYEQTGSSNANAPWVQKTYTYDDYNTTNGLDQSNPSKFYHNTLTEVLSGSNVPTSTRKLTYATTNTTVNGLTYHNIHSVTHAEIDDSNGNISQCSDTKYDEGVASGVPTPAQGLPTTTTTYSNGCNPSSAITTYTGYDTDGNSVATVDGVATASPSLYTGGNAGCNTVTPKFLASAWTAGRFTTCSAYSAANTQATDKWNVFSQHTLTSYDATQGLQATAATDANNLTTSTIYSYDSSGNPIVQTKSPNEPGIYTKQGTLKSTCTDSSVFPCLELDSNSSLYSGAVTQVFYDSMDRKVETLTPGPDATHTTVSFTVYNDVNHSAFTSQPLVLAPRTAWLDPNDSSLVSLGGIVTYYDATGRTIALMDALFKNNGNSGIGCSSLAKATANWAAPLTNSTSCIIYGINTSGMTGDSKFYNTTMAIDANNHVGMNYTDALGRVVSSVAYSGVNSGTITPTRRTTTVYNVLNKPVSVMVTDLAPQPGQTITSVTTTSQYDSLGRVTVLQDPDRGTHTYTYDENDHLIGDAIGSGVNVRSIGTKYDLLERVGCVQNSIPASTDVDINGACSAGTTPYVQNKYDKDPTGITWSGANYALGKITQSITTTSYPTPDNATGTVTQNYQYDQRGRSITNSLNIAVSGGSISFPTLPQYKEVITYNDADQPTTTQTTAGGQAGYMFTQVYDSITGMQIGLSNSDTSPANLATLSYNGNALVSDILFKDSSGASLADRKLLYDGDLRPTSTTATWSNNNSTIYSDAVSYDNAGNVVSRATTHATVPGMSSSGGSETQNFCYDEQNQLVWASNTASAPTVTGQTCGNAALQSTLGGGYNNTYVYTNLGQLWQAPLNGNGTQEQYLYCNVGEPHQFTALSPASGNPTCTNAGTTDYNASYDAYGNMVTRTYPATTTGTQVYDAQDQLIHWNGTTPTNSEGEWYLYDVLGNRVMRRSANTASGSNIATSAATITIYAFGLEEHVYQYSGTGTSATNIGNTYYYSVAGHMVGTLSGVDTLSTNFLFTDLLNSVVSTISNTSGSAVLLSNQVYGPYGNKRYSAGSMGTAKGFTGQYADDLTGFDYYNARYYDPASGRFLSADTVEGDIQGLDPYTYVGNNPETKIDPTGHASVDPGFGYVYMWYEALHSGENIRGDIPGMDTRIPGGKPDIINDTRHIVWEAKSGLAGQIQGLDASGNPTMAYGTRELTGSRLSSQLYDARTQLGNATQNGYTRGSIYNDPNVAAFFSQCGASVCDFTAPDGALVTLYLPDNTSVTRGRGIRTIDNAGIIIYQVQYTPYTPSTVGEFVITEDKLAQMAQAARALVGSTNWRPVGTPHLGGAPAGGAMPFNVQQAISASAGLAAFVGGIVALWQAASNALEQGLIPAL